MANKLTNSLDFVAKWMVEKTAKELDRYKKKVLVSN